MSIPEIDSSQNFEAIADEQLQQELRGLFAVDTQNYLQKYSEIAQSLNASSWRSQIQELYRCVHTIKGGAVTIGAEAVLRVATALEDVLADLRYLELAPPLADNHLSQALMEAGELLTGSLEPGQHAEGQEPILKRIQFLHQDIRERYLPQWNEVSQLHQEFAEEGLDLVVLELEIALERLPAAGMVSDSTVQVAQQILAQLAAIGEELKLALGWTALLQHAQSLLEHRDNATWRSHWTLLFQALKTCAKQSGKPVPFEFPPFLSANIPSATVPSANIPSANIPSPPFEPNESNGWTIEPSDAVGNDAHPRSTLDQPEALLHDLEPTGTLDSLSDSLGTFLDGLNLVEASSAAESINWLTDRTPAADSLSDWLDADPHLDESCFVDDRQPPELIPDSSNQTEPALDAEPDQDWLMGTFLDALHPIDAVVPQVVDFLDDSFSLDDAAPVADIDHPLNGSDLLESNRLDDYWELEPTPGSPHAIPYSIRSPLAAELVQDWLAVEEPVALNGFAHLPSPVPESHEGVNGSQSLYPASVANEIVPSKPDRAIEALAKVQIPVPLETLDQSSQHLVETLLTLRTTQGYYQSLQSQITQIVALAQEGTQYIAHLRQIQDDYTLLEELSHSTQAAAGPTPERYRQGYTVINRLLETSLRLSEIGAETGKTTQQIETYLQSVDRKVLKLQSTIEESRLVPFQNLSFRAKAILRDLTTRYNKPARLLVQGEKTELDVTIARSLEPALLHLIRNAYDHGLESPHERIANGKPEQGTITLSLQRQGNRFQFEIQDDGRGMDASAIQTRAEALHLPLCNAQTPADLLTVICQPGFSAQNQVSEISGRGVGMDVVAAQVARLGGRLSLSTVPGSGTTFQIQFPVPRLLVPCVLLQAGDQTVAIPEDDIRTITLWSDLDASPVEDASRAYAWTIHTAAESLPALDLLKYWQPRTTDRTLADTTVCLRITIAGKQQGVWLLADALLEQAELIINPIPLPLAAPNGLIGVSLQVNGSLVPVLEAQALAEQLLTAPAIHTEATAIAPSEPNQRHADYSAQSILIVDDAALMRRRLEASLHGNGYLTHTCADGQEAWHWLQVNPRPDLVITDIEMPNMDGFTLVDRCRQAGITVPILVVSSRLSEEWFDEARRLGANDYLTKGFSTVTLLKKVDALLNLVTH